ncbi:hypothetical protein BJ912DRAFT_1049759 [Pholiota molesta]|nr:hypothetical protein BJ912DRAFT_1049759 [Pholiota molesta]
MIPFKWFKVKHMQLDRISFHILYVYNHNPPLHLGYPGDLYIVIGMGNPRVPSARPTPSPAKPSTRSTGTGVSRVWVAGLTGFEGLETRTGQRHGRRVRGVVRPSRCRSTGVVKAGRRCHVVITLKGSEVVLVRQGRSATSASSDTPCLSRRRSRWQQRKHTHGHGHPPADADANRSAAEPTVRTVAGTLNTDDVGECGFCACGKGWGGARKALVPARELRRRPQGGGGCMGGPRVAVHPRDPRLRVRVGAGIFFFIVVQSQQGTSFVE